MQKVQRFIDAFHPFIKPIHQWEKKTANLRGMFLSSKNIGFQTPEPLSKDLRFFNETRYMCKRLKYRTKLPSDSRVFMHDLDIAWVKCLPCFDNLRKNVTAGLNLVG